MTPKELEYAKVSDSYAKLQRDILNELIRRLNEASLIGLDGKNALEWQAKQLSETDAILHDLLPEIAKQLKMSDEQLQEFLTRSGNELLEETTKALEQKLKQVHKPVSDDTQALLDAYQNQTFRDINNTVNQSLLTTNYRQNAVAIAYQEMAKKTALSVMTGYQTPEQAIKSVSMEWVGKGLTSPLIDKGGHSWSVETYSRMLINNTVHRTANELRMQRAQDYGITTAVMNSHPAAREACAYIQGKVVNTVPEGTEGYDNRFDTIYNHGYGKAAGTLGINCTHTLTPFDPDTMTNPYKQYDPEKAIANGEQKAKQRQLERSIRNSKKNLAAAEKLGDSNLIAKYKSQVRGKQKKLRDHIADHDFLGRDYSRERVFADTKPISFKGLASGSESFNSTSRYKYLGRVDHDQVQRTMSQFNNAISKAPNENALIIASDGKMYQVAGTKGQVDITVVGKEHLKSAVVSHNHPDTFDKTYNSFSKADLYALQEYGISELNMVYKGQIHRVSYAGPTNIQLSSKYNEAEFQVSFNKANSKCVTMDAVTQHEIMLELQKMIQGLHYD